MKIEAAAIAASEVCEAEVSSTISSDDETVGEEGTKAKSKDSGLSSSISTTSLTSATSSSSESSVKKDEVSFFSNYSPEYI